MPTTTSTLRGIGVSGFSVVIARGMMAVTYLWIVSRVTPLEVGIITIGLSVYGFFGIFKDFGFTAAIVSKKDTPAEYMASAYSLRLIISSILAVASLAAAAVLPLLFDEPRLGLVFIVTSIAIIAEAFGFLSSALLQRDFEFRTLAIADIASAFAMAVGAFAVVEWGAPLYAVFAGITLSSVTKTIILVAYRPMPMRFVRGGLREKSLLAFGSRLVAASLVIYAFLNLNVFVLGKVDVEGLGFYGLALFWATTPTDVASGAVNRVMFPTYSALVRRGGGVLDGYLRTLRYLFIAALPFFLFLYLASSILIQWLYGSDWEQAADIIPIFLVLGMSRLLLEPAGSLLVSLGRPGLILGTNLVNLALMAAFAVPVAMSLGALGSAVLLTLVYLIHMSLLWYLVLHLLGGKAVHIASAMIRPLLASLSALGIGLLILRLSAGATEGLLTAMISVAIYLFVLYFVSRNDLQTAIGYIGDAFRIESKRKQ